MNGRLLRLEEPVSARYHGISCLEKEMTEKRVQETINGIPDEVTAEEYNEMQKNLRDCGHLPVNYLKEGTHGGEHALEIGSGPGFLGLEWLNETIGTRL